MAGFELGMGEVRQFAAVLSDIGIPLGSNVRQAVSKGALNIKTQMRAEADQSRHFRFSSAITYSLKDDASTSSAEIGPEKGSPGSIANIAYFGTSRGGGTVPDPRGALDAESPAFTEALADIAERLLTT